MKNLPLLLLCSILFFGCANNKKGESQSEQKRLLDNCNVIARYDVVNGDTITVCDYPSVKQVLNIPISRIVEEVEVVKLQTPDSISTMLGRVYVTENYLLLQQDSRGVAPYLLFKRDGSFIRTLGRWGNGPNELSSSYDEYIDEEHERLYVMPWKNNKLLAFDLKGNNLPHIPLSYQVPKAQFKIDIKRERLTVVQLPFEGTKKQSLVWVQDFKGNVIQEIDATPHEVKPDYSHEVISLKNSDAFDFQLLKYGKKDELLYHYQESSNRLVPKLALDFNGTEPFANCLYDLNHQYYMVNKAQYTFYGQENNTEPIKLKDILIDKQTLRGAYINWKVDLLGNIPGPEYCDYFSKGYLVINLYPITLKEQLSAALRNRDKLSPETVGRMTQLNNSLAEDDNNVLIIGKMKR